MTSSSTPPVQTGQPASESKRELDRFELDQLADKIIDLMKREVIHNIEREGKLP